MNRRLLPLLVLPLLAACGHSASYNAKPVVKDADGEWREVDTPGLDEPEVWKTEECFQVDIEASGWNRHTRKVGIACLDDDNYPEEGEK